MQRGTHLIEIGPLGRGSRQHPAYQVAQVSAVFDVDRRVAPLGNALGESVETVGHLFQTHVWERAARKRRIRSGLYLSRK